MRPGPSAPASSFLAAYVASHLSVWPAGMALQLVPTAPAPVSGWGHRWPCPGERSSPLSTFPRVPDAAPGMKTGRGDVHSPRPAGQWSARAITRGRVMPPQFMFRRMTPAKTKSSRCGAGRMARWPLGRYSPRAGAGPASRTWPRRVPSALSEDGRWLLVANAGSDELSLFAVQPDGLRLADWAGSGGTRRPASRSAARLSTCSITVRRISAASAS